LYDSKEIGELLISKGAYINAKEYSKGSTPLHIAAFMIQSKDMIELLISKGADVNIKDREGTSPLAFFNYQSEIMTKVLEIKFLSLSITSISAPFDINNSPISFELFFAA